MSLIKDYFQKTEELQKNYGEKSVILMQVGSFYEIYGLKKKDDIFGSQVKQVAEICEIDIANKKNFVGKHGVVMAGFGIKDYILEKYLKKLQDSYYTVAVYDEVKECGTIKDRTLTNIYSPGTYFSNDNQSISNNITCIWCQKSIKSIIIGASNIDIFTGKSSIFEYEEELIKHNTIFDELELFISIYNPNEIILIYDLEDEKYIESLISFASIKTNCIHKVNLKSVEVNEENVNKAKKCTKQIYQKEIMNYYFTDQFIDDVYSYEVACQSFCYLLEFIQSHNPSLIQKISVPKYENSNNRTLLGNYSLKQLNIIGCDSVKTKFNSVEELLNMCITSMGKRRISHIITHPTFNSNKLNQEYDICTYLIQKDKIDETRNKLSSIKDLEKINRKFFLCKIVPSELYHLYTNLQTINELYVANQRDKKIKTFVNSFIFESITDICNTIRQSLDNYLDIKNCKSIFNLHFEENIIQKGIFETHDKNVETYIESFDKLNALENYFDNILKNKEKKTKTNKFVSIKETDKSGFSLLATSRRTKILIDELQKTKESTIHYLSSYDNTEKVFVINNTFLQKVNFGNSNNSYIESPEIKELCKTIQFSKIVMLDSLTDCYKKIVKILSEYSDKINIIVDYISTIDVIFNKAHVSKIYNLSKPNIDTQKDSSFFDVVGLRHPLIENLLYDETYIANDICLNDENLGILLYGINAIGKSSLIKSIGICVIMAQTGFFVPCEKLNFQPYHHIFTRIIGNDNIFKGLSTFAVEMLELNNILKFSNKNSLVLGDELCSGTENDSAKGIILSGLDHLYKNKCNFIFATHIHEITDYEEIKSKDLMSIKHMSVQYDHATDNLIYYRKLKDGPGDSMYGLEVCKYLHMPKEFLEYAHNIRNKYSHQKSILDYKPTRYNSGKLRGTCELCQEEISTETHHLQHQKKANKKNGFINDFHKDVNGNLLNVCETCHLKLHNQKKEHVKTKTSRGFILEEI